MKIIKPKIDDRNYKYLKLKNQLEVLIIEDKNKNISSACMTVNVGHYHDPADFLGMAHFLEHMLFMGTKKYPVENHFFDFINTHGGSTNAFTSSEITSFFFDILSDKFDEALDIFAQFFIDPLLLMNAVDREIKAVNSEHEKNIKQDSWRIGSILKELSISKHPLSKFGTGNNKTLGKKNIYDELKKFHEKYYSANIMKLAVYTNNITKIEEEIKTIFSKIPNNQVIIDKIDTHPFNTDKLNICKLVPIIDEHSLICLWQLDSTLKYYKINPINHISYILNFDGKGSLKSQLQEYGYVIDMHWFPYDDDSGTDLYGCSMTLTDAGFENVPFILNLVNKNIKLIKNLDNRKELYNDIKQANIINFNYKSNIEPINYANQLSINMFKYPIEEILTAEWIFDEYNKDVDKIIYETVLDQLIDKNRIVIISSKKFHNKTDKCEEFYGAEYSIYQELQEFYKDFPSNKVINLSKIQLPTKNMLIPQNTNIVKLKNIPQYPTEIKKDLWFKSIDKFKVPKVLVGVTLSTGKIYQSPKNVILTHLFLIILHKTLSSILYYGQICSSTFSFSLGSDCLNLYFESYSDTIKTFISEIYKKIINLKITENLFKYGIELVKNRIDINLNNPPYVNSSDELNSILVDNYYRNTTLSNALKRVTFNDLVGFNLVASIYSKKTLIQGNISPTDAENINNIFKIGFSKNVMNHLKIKEIEDGRKLKYLIKPFNPEEHNSCVNYFFEFGKIIKGKAGNWEEILGMLSLINITTSDNFFHELRSKSQTGYVVRVSPLGYHDYNEGLYGLSFLVQSSEYDVVEIEKRIRKFIKGHQNLFIKNLGERKFNKYIITLIKNLKESDNNLSEEFTRNMNEITKNSFVFNYKAKLIEYLKNINLNDLKDAYHKYFISNEAKVRIVAIESQNKKLIEFRS